MTSPGDGVLIGSDFLMNYVVLMVIASTMVLEYLAETGLAPKPIAYIPELLSGVALLYVIAEGSRTRFRHIRGIYWVVFGAATLHIIFGIAANEVAPGPIFTGIRNIFRAIPLFLLPAVFNFSEQQIRGQLWLIGAISVLQFPLALYQKVSLRASGDAISGTLLNTAFLSPFLVCVACVLTGFYVRNRIPLWRYALLSVLVLAPTAINETKVTVFLVPLGLVTVFILGSKPGVRLRNAIAATTMSVVLLAAFVPVYNYTQKDVEGSFNIFEFLSDPQKATSYLQTDAGLGADGGGVTYVGRIDALVIPFKYITREPIHMWFGLGLGNASLTPLGAQFQGDYARLFELFMNTTVARLLLEVGVGGLLLSLLLMLLIFCDARVVADNDDGPQGAFAAGWIGVSVVMFVLIFYSDTIASTCLAFLYWYFSGLLTSQRMQMAVRAITGSKQAVRAIAGNSSSVLGRAR